MAVWSSSTTVSSVVWKRNAWGLCGLLCGEQPESGSKLGGFYWCLGLGLRRSGVSGGRRGRWWLGRRQRRCRGVFYRLFYITSAILSGNFENGQIFKNLLKWASRACMYEMGKQKSSPHGRLKCTDFLFFVLFKIVLGRPI